jgi:hypothetical protein
MTVIVEQLQAPISNGQQTLKPPIFGFRIVERISLRLGKTVAIHESEILESARKEVCLRKIQGE